MSGRSSKQLDDLEAARLGRSIADAILGIPRDSQARMQKAIDYVVEIAYRRLVSAGYSQDDFIGMFSALISALMSRMEDQNKEQADEHQRAEETHLTAEADQEARNIFESPESESEVR